MSWTQMSKHQFHASNSSSLFFPSISFYLYTPSIHSFWITKVYINNRGKGVTNVSGTTNGDIFLIRIKWRLEVIGKITTPIWMMGTKNVYKSFSVILQYLSKALNMLIHFYCQITSILEIYSKAILSDVLKHLWRYLLQCFYNIEKS